MVNKIRSTIGGLALMASTAFGASVTNAPVSTSLEVISGSARDVITLSATNFNSNAKFNLYKSTNLTDWVKVNLPVAYSGSNPTSVVVRSYSESDSSYRGKAFYQLKTN